jgi:hypothetical protein
MRCLIIGTPRPFLSQCRVCGWMTAVKSARTADQKDRHTLAPQNPYRVVSHPFRGSQGQGNESGARLKTLPYTTAGHSCQSKTPPSSAFRCGSRRQDRARRAVIPRLGPPAAVTMAHEAGATVQSFDALRAGFSPMRTLHAVLPYSAVVPPSMTSSLPVTYDDSSEARYRTP